MKKLLIYIILLPFMAAGQMAQEPLRAYEEKMLPKTGPCISKSEHDAIKERVHQFKKEMEAKGQLDPARTAVFGAHAFRWPLAPAKHNHHQNYYYISNYVDLNPVSAGLNGSDPNHTLEDYNCGSRTYDVQDNGYDHSGIDIATGPFGWTMMDNDDVDVIAAEGGVIAEKDNNEFDRTCRTGVATTSAGNYIAITHYDGSTTYYFHMKQGSLTSKSIGDYVMEGEYLGKVGSSGNSTGPHLHFEVHDDLGDVRDPFQNGNCASGGPSLWADEEPYINKQIVAGITLSSPWTDAQCDTNGLSNGTSGSVPYCNHFTAGSPIWFTAAVRDIQVLGTVQVRIYNPSGSVIYNNTYTEGSLYRKLLVLQPLFTVAPNISGQYRLMVTYNGVSRAHYFTVGCPGSITLQNTRSSNYGYLSGGNITSMDNISASARNVQYQAETYIDLKDGFFANNGCEFTAFIDNCTTGGTRTEFTASSDIEFLIAPNPANDVIKIIPSGEFNGGVCTVTILNASGAVVQKQEALAGTEVSVSGLPDGLYLVELQVVKDEHSFRSAQKLIIHH
jgi:murein DD-endopeptidase MepM/ murein hydrolase activator NlpD